MDTKLLLKLLAPYRAVGVFWCGLSNGWLAILAYHAQILFWAWRCGPSGSGMWRPVPQQFLPFVLSAALAGPLLYILLPILTGSSLPAWSSPHG